MDTLGVLLEGKALPLPKTTSNAAAKSFHVIAKPYESLAQIFETATASRLKSEFEVGTQLWLNDCNKGLVQQVIAAFKSSRFATSLISTAKFLSRKSSVRQ